MMELARIAAHFSTGLANAPPWLVALVLIAVLVAVGLFLRRVLRRNQS